MIRIIITHIIENMNRIINKETPYILFSVWHLLFTKTERKVDYSVNHKKRNAASNNQIRKEKKFRVRIRKDYANVTEISC